MTVPNPARLSATPESQGDDCSLRLFKLVTTDGLPQDRMSPVMPTISLHADEFKELIGDEFVPPLNKAGSVVFQVTADTRSCFAVEACIGLTTQDWCGQRSKTAHSCRGGWPVGSRGKDALRFGDPLLCVVDSRTDEKHRRISYTVSLGRMLTGMERGRWSRMYASILKR